MGLYEDLGLTRGASAADVQRAYRRLVRRYHPDLNPGNAEAARRYADVTRAFETLSDPARRRAYDEHGQVAGEDRPGGVAFAGFDFSVTVEGGAASTFGDLFVDVFRAAADARTVSGAPVGEHLGADIHATLTLSLDEVLHGAVRVVEMARRVTCATCTGAGRVERAAVRCASCHGTGHARLARGHMTFVRPCATCTGEGVVRHWICPACQGAGVQTRLEQQRVCLPPGLSDGDEWREPGAGHVGTGGAAAGDLRLHVTVTPDRHWRRLDDDLHRSVPIAIHEAVLGVRMALDTPDGPVRLRVPPGTQGGQRLRLRGRGVPSRRTGARGDLVITVHLVLPRVIDARGRELMAEFARLHPEDVRQELDADRA